MKRYTVGLVATWMIMSGCDSDSPALQLSPLQGQWGTDGVVLVLDADGGRVHYECAAGRIDEPIILDGAGRFRVQGEHAIGPVLAERLEVIYTGVVREGRMDLRIVRNDTGLAIATYVLRQGEGILLHPCQ